MRRTLIVISVLAAIAGSALVILLRRADDPPLTIVPIRHAPANDSTEKLMVAVTNNTSFEIVGYLGQGTNLAGGSKVQLASHCGSLVVVYGPRHGPWLIGGAYQRHESDTEAKARLFLLGHTPLRGNALTMLDGVVDKPIQWVRMEE